MVRPSHRCYSRICITIERLPHRSILVMLRSNHLQPNLLYNYRYRPFSLDGLDQTGVTSAQRESKVVFYAAAETAEAKDGGRDFTAESGEESSGVKTKESRDQGNGLDELNVLDYVQRAMVRPVDPLVRLSDKVCGLSAPGKPNETC